jgi:hypothetical protein
MNTKISQIIVDDISQLSSDISQLSSNFSKLSEDVGNIYSNQIQDALNIFPNQIQYIINKLPEEIINKLPKQIKDIKLPEQLTNIITNSSKQIEDIKLPEQITNIINYSSKQIENITSYNSFKSIIFIFLILYIIIVKPTISLDIINFIENKPWIRCIIVLYILYVSTYDLVLSIIITILFLLTIYIINKQTILKLLNNSKLKK